MQRFNNMNGLNNTTARESSVVNFSNESANHSPGPLPLPFGYRHFNNNQEAHSFVNTVLNSGSGYTGTVAGARNLTSDPAPLAQLNGTSRSVTRFNNDVEARSLLNAGGPNSFVGFGRSVGLHGTMPNVSVRSRPIPPSCLFVLASVDTPIRPNGATSLVPAERNNNPSPTRSIGSISISSVPPSEPPVPCSCPYCRSNRCVCHLYCGRHAELRCPVHGMGLNSYEMSRCITPDSDDFF